MVKMAIYKAEIKSRELKSRMRHKNSTGQRKHDHSNKFHCVVKRGARWCEKYDERKVYGSTYAACSVVLMSEWECERIANSVSKKITQHVRKKKEVASEDIATQIVKELKKHNPHAAFMYETHRDLA